MDNDQENIEISKKRLTYLWYARNYLSVDFWTNKKETQIFSIECNGIERIFFFFFVHLYVDSSLYLSVSKSKIELKFQCRHLIILAIFNVYFQNWIPSKLHRNKNNENDVLKLQITHRSNCYSCFLFWFLFWFETNFLYESKTIAASLGKRNVVSVCEFAPKFNTHQLDLCHLSHYSCSICSICSTCFIWLKLKRYLIYGCCLFYE